MNQVLTAVPQVQAVAAAIEVAARNESPAEVHDLLARWTVLAADIVGALPPSDPNAVQLDSSMRTSIRYGLAARRAWETSATTTLNTRRFRTAMNAAVVAATEYAARLKTYTGE